MKRPMTMDYERVDTFTLPLKYMQDLYKYIDYLESQKSEEEECPSCLSTKESRKQTNTICHNCPKEEL